jgi:hypothetical protein
MVISNLEAEWKFVSIQCFTEKIHNPRQLIEENVYFPGILVAMSGCIGAGLDSPDVTLVV